MGDRIVEHAPAGPGDVPGLLDRLRRALAGAGPVLVPYDGRDIPPPLPVPGPGQPDLAVVMSTSGSTGAARLVGLTAENLRASAVATDAVLAGPGRWTLAVPAQHIAGLQVLVRSALAATVPVVVAPAAAGGFIVERFAAALEDAPAGTDPEYVSLVPTQLVRLLESDRGRAALARYDAVLLGGAAAATGLLARAADERVRVITTYGMTETAGGCVYDGRPLPGVRVEVEPGGRIRLGGPTVAAGYLPPPDGENPFLDLADTRWFRTNDAGHLVNGVLTVHGRVDDVVNTGGVKVRPAEVEDALLTHLPGLREAVVLGIADELWGQVVAAALVGGGDGPAYSLEEVRDALRGRVRDAALPRRVVTLDALPSRGPGKPDRDALRTLLGSAATYDQR